MASMARHVLRRSIASPSPASRVLNRQEPPALYLVKRHLFSNEILGIDGFQRQRILTADRLGDLKATFIQRMDELMKADEKSTVFTDDLKTILHTTENEEDLTTALAMLKRYNAQNSEMQFGRFTFGPILLRLLHLMKKADCAYELFQDESFKGFFDQISSHIIMIDMLYEAGKYQTVLEMFQLVSNRKLNGHKYPVDCTTVALGALYKINTPEAFETMVTILQGCKETGSNLSNRSITFAALLALNQNKPASALEIVSNKFEIRSISLDNIKAIAFCQLGRVEDVLPILRRVLQHDSAYQSTALKIFPETVSAVQEAVAAAAGDQNLKHQVNTMIEGLHAGALISDTTLLAFAEQPVQRRRQQLQNSFKARLRSSVGGMRSHYRDHFHQDAV